MLPAPPRRQRVPKRRPPLTWARIARQILVFIFTVMHRIVQTVVAATRRITAWALIQKAYLVALFCRTPEEIAKDMEVRLLRRGMKTRIVTIDGCDDDSFKTEYIRMPRRTKEQENCLLVKLHRDMDHLWLDSFIWDYVEYKDNKVDLRPLQNKWNLENIYAVDCQRRQVYEWPGQPGVLSGHAVRLLTENQDWLRVIEKPSQATIRGRKLRLWYLDRDCELSFRQLVKPVSSFVEGFRKGMAGNLEK